MEELSKIIIFYILLIILGSGVGYFIGQNRIDKISYSFIGFVIGSLLSLILWYSYGIKMVKMLK